MRISNQRSDFENEDLEDNDIKVSFKATGHELVYRVIQGH